MQSTESVKADQNKKYLLRYTKVELIEWCMYKRFLKFKISTKSVIQKKNYVAHKKVRDTKSWRYITKSCCDYKK